MGWQSSSLLPTFGVPPIPALSCRGRGALHTLSLFLPTISWHCHTQAIDRFQLVELYHLSDQWPLQGVITFRTNPRVCRGWFDLMFLKNKWKVFFFSFFFKQKTSPWPFMYMMSWIPHAREDERSRGISAQWNRELDAADCPLNWAEPKIDFETDSEAPLLKLPRLYLKWSIFHSLIAKQGCAAIGFQPSNHVLNLGR